MIPSSGQIDFQKPPTPKQAENLKKQHKVPDTAFHDYIESLISQKVDLVADIPERKKDLEVPKTDKADIEIKIQEDTNQEKLDKLKETSEPLIGIKTHLPINFLFSQEIVVDINSVTLISKQLLGAKQVVSIAIENITDVIVESIPIFATMRIYDRGFAQISVSVRFLKKSEAIEAREIIQGLMAAQKQGIDLYKVDQDSIYNKLLEIGKTEEKV